MPSLTIASWVLLRLFRQPASWIGLGLVILVWGVAAALSPVGMTTSTAGLAALFYELAFVSTLTGGALALVPLSEAQWFLARLDGWTRLRVRAVGLASGAGLGLALSLALPALVARSLLFGLDAGTLAAVLLTLLHTILLGLLLLEMPLEGSARALCLPLVAWVLPALLPGSGELPALLRSLLDVSAHLDPGRRSSPGLGFPAGAPLLALAGTLALLETRSWRPTLRRQLR